MKHQLTFVMDNEYTDEETLLCVKPASHHVSAYVQCFILAMLAWGFARENILDAMRDVADE